MPIRISLALITLLLAISLAGAEMYQWVDEKGVVTFKDTPPPKKRKKVKVYADEDFAAAPPVKSAPAAPAARKTVKKAEAAKPERFSGTVELFVTEWCGYCKKAKQYLHRNGIAYVAYDIEKDSAANQRCKALGGRGVPVIVIDGHRVNGFSEEIWDHYLNIGRE